jgi:peptidoglycan hydrolase-like protein with peptidoglycan-binding domain
MKKMLVAAALIAVSIYAFGCTKNKATMDESQELLSMDQMSAITVTPQTPQTAGGAVSASVPAQGAPKTSVDVQLKNVEPTVAANLEPLPPSGPYKPSGVEIQTALKNAGYYTGVVDGKVGPMTKEAIEDFQKANNLEADGKVGPKTWVALSKHLTAKVQSAVSSD